MNIPCFTCGVAMRLNGDSLACPICKRKLETVSPRSTAVARQSPQTPSRPVTSRQSRIGQRNKAAGDNSEEIAHLQLAALGLERIRKIETGWGVQRENGIIVNAWPLPKHVQGDFTAIDPHTGRYALVEVKSHERIETLRWTDFDDHQRDELAEHAACGGLSLVCWMPPGGSVYVMEWQIITQQPWPGFRKYHPLTMIDAEKCQWPGIA